MIFRNNSKTNQLILKRDLKSIKSKEVKENHQNRVILIILYFILD